MKLDSTTEEYFAQLEYKIPELASSADLVRLGIFSSEAALCKARKSGDTPTFIRFSRGRIRYPRASVITFLLERVNQGKNDARPQKEMGND